MVAVGNSAGLKGIDLNSINTKDLGELTIEQLKSGDVDDNGILDPAEGAALASALQSAHEQFNKGQQTNKASDRGLLNPYPTKPEVQRTLSGQGLNSAKQSKAESIHAVFRRAKRTINILERRLNMFVEKLPVSKDKQRLQSDISGLARKLRDSVSVKKADGQWKVSIGYMYGSLLVVEQKLKADSPAMQTPDQMQGYRDKVWGAVRDRGLPYLQDPDPVQQATLQENSDKFDARYKLQEDITALVRRAHEAGTEVDPVSTPDAAKVLYNRAYNAVVRPQHEALLERARALGSSVATEELGSTAEEVLKSMFKQATEEVGVHQQTDPFDRLLAPLLNYFK